MLARAAGGLLEPASTARESKPPTANRSRGSPKVGLRFTPGELGDDAFLALAARLTPLLPEEIRPGRLAMQFARDPASFPLAAASLLATRPARAEILVFINQFEELLTVVAESHRASFVELLAAAAATPRLRLVISMRADFHPRRLDWPRLPKALCTEAFSVRAPGLAALCETIAAPAARARLKLEEELLAAFVDARLLVSSQHPAGTVVEVAAKRCSASGHGCGSGSANGADDLRAPQNAAARRFRVPVEQS